MFCPCQWWVSKKNVDGEGWVGEVSSIQLFYYYPQIWHRRCLAFAWTVRQKSQPLRFFRWINDPVFVGVGFPHAKQCRNVFIFQLVLIRLLAVLLLSASIFILVVGGRSELSSFSKEYTEYVQWLSTMFVHFWNQAPNLAHWYVWSLESLQAIEPPRQRLLVAGSGIYWTCAHAAI